MPDHVLNAEHGITCRLPPDQRFSYFGWPIVARLDDGTLVVGSSGLRKAAAGEKCSPLWSRWKLPPHAGAAP